MAHELFHRIQDRLNLPKLHAGENAQLDTLDGRYYLQLEWRALARAFEAATSEECKTAAADALLFRAERYRLFPGAAAREHALELNEGLAEYTGVRIANTTPEEQTEAALSDLATHAKDPTFVRSFAYATGPAYGLLLDRFASEWHRDLSAGYGFDVLLQNALHIGLPPNPQQAAEERSIEYGGASLRAAEAERDSTRRQAIAHYRAEFLDGPVLIIRLQHMRVQFDPRNLQPLGDAGTVYPNMRISDDWGILEVADGALLKSDWSEVIVTATQSVTGNSIKGDGWSLDLKPGWKIVAAARKGDFTLAAGS